MKNIFIIIILNIVFIGYPAAAQELNGKITEQNASPLQNALIYNKTEHSHEHSNEMGLFTLLNASPGDTVEFSFIGFKSKVIILSEADFAKALFEVVLTEQPLEFNDITISNNLQNTLLITKIDQLTNPVNTAQDFLRIVPGLVIGQHAGGGKAEQIFLRGFDIDHGTDISLQVDGMPVNMVSHAHGQGYADLHFLIPETVDNIDFGKGPYAADKGNFSTAGYVGFTTKDKLDFSQVTLEYGQFNSLRVLAVVDLLSKVEKHDAYIAADMNLTDGPFVSPQNFNRFNLFAKYTVRPEEGKKISFSASHFTSRWDASGQVPMRAVNAGMISRFGSIDDTEGGKTNRTNVNIQYSQLLDKNTLFSNQMYYVNYNFELFSNFTFFLNDSINGDQIHQHENRHLIGGQSTLSRRWSLDKGEFRLKGGLGFRYDDSNNNELSHTLSRKAVLQYYSLGHVNELNASAYLQATLEYKDWTVVAGGRLDYFNFGYINELDTVYNSRFVKLLLPTPKLSILHNTSKNLQLYFKTGLSFHSNDSRAVVAQQGQFVLPLAYGSDIGLTWKPFGRLLVDMAAWYLQLQQEFVYVGDEAVVEAGGRTRRLGADLSLRYQLIKGLFADANVNYAFARSVEAAPGENYIPLAPDLVATGGLYWKHPAGISAGLRSRYVKTRPANEDASILAKGYFVVDMNANYRWRNFQVGFRIENLFNTQWNETQFATTSRLQNEAVSVEEIHFTPGTPFGFKGKISYIF